MGSCGCISSRNTDNKKRSKSVGNPGADAKQRQQDLQKITKSIIDGEAVVLKKNPSKEYGQQIKTKDDQTREDLKTETKNENDQTGIHDMSGVRNTAMETQALQTVVQEHGQHLVTSEITNMTKKKPQFTHGIDKEDSDQSQDMVFQEQIEDVDESIVVDQDDIGLQIHTQESYKNVRAIKPSDDKSLRDFQIYNSELEVISKTRNTVISMMVKNNKQMSMDPPQEITHQKSALAVRREESSQSQLFQHLQVHNQVLHSEVSAAVSIQSKQSRQRKKLSHTESVDQPRDASRNDPHRHRNSDGDSWSCSSCGW